MIESILQFRHVKYVILFFVDGLCAPHTQMDEHSLNG